jgi:hypothetical protein
MQRLWDWADEHGVPDLTWVTNEWQPEEGQPEEGYWRGIPRGKEALLSVTGLNLQQLGIETLPPEIGKLTNLKSLNLDENKLTELPCEIRNLTQLTSLSISWNEFSSLNYS